jgi:hypothetical protein
VNAAELPIRARVALALAAADHSLPELQANSKALSAARAALSDGWRWTAGKGVRARDLYTHIHTLLPLEPSVEADPRATSALYALIDALYYAAWHAQAFDTSEGEQLPNDMAEIGEDSLTSALDHATQATNSDAWQARAIQHLVAATVGTGPADAGPVITREQLTDA